MSGMNLSDVLFILNESHPSTPLTKALSMAQSILELSRNITDSVAQESYNKGFTDGQNSHPVVTLLEQKNKARANVADIVRKTGSHKKIQCIKQLRELTGLGLKDTKDIVDQYVRTLDGYHSWERELVDPLYVPRAY